MTTGVRANGHELERTGTAALGVGLGATLALNVGAFLLPNPAACRWCTPTAFDEALHTPVAPENRRAVAAASHAISFVVLPVGGLAALVVPPFTGDGPKRHAGENAAIFGEALLANTAITLATKKAVARRRPAFYYGRSQYTEFASSENEQYLSFFSGDTSIAFVSASAASTLSFMRGYRSAPYVTASSAVLATAVGLMRVGADVHWPSDVLTGAVVGTSVGIALPLLLHPRKSNEAASSSQRALPLVHVQGWF